MSALLYLLVAVLLSLLGTLALWLHQRRPTSMEAGIEEFHKGMRALAPSDRPRRRSSVRPVAHADADDDGADPDAGAATNGARGGGREAGRGARHLSGEGRASAG